VAVALNDGRGGERKIWRRRGLNGMAYLCPCAWRGVWKAVALWRGGVVKLNEGKEGVAVAGEEGRGVTPMWAMSEGLGFSWRLN